ncbi:MAG: hypothetical protein IJ785_04525 [Bacteroidales bacterium]|nr:hypothetical protein [Bacteroidales bacterium]
MSRQGHSGFRDWAGIILLAATSAVCLLLYFFPKEPQGLVGLSEPAGRCEWTGKREVFLGSGLLLGMGYSCMEIIGQPAEFYSDFSMPVLHGEDSVRLWIDPKDRDRLLKAKAEGSDERMRVKVHRIDVLDSYTGWRRYVAEHPHGGGGWFAGGALLGILSLVLVVKKIFFA